MKSIQQFWMVANANFPTTIRYMHWTFEDAKKEAERLARLTKDTFYVLEAVSFYQVKDVEEIFLEEDQNIPF
jgi:hypothetical protein